MTYCEVLRYLKQGSSSISLQFFGLNMNLHVKKSTKVKKNFKYLFLQA